MSNYCEIMVNTMDEIERKNAIKMGMNANKYAFQSKMANDNGGFMT